MVLQQEPALRLALPPGGLDLAATLDCGQAFRWRPRPGVPDCWQGVAGSSPAVLRLEEGDLILEAPGTPEAFWRRYLDLDRDYDAIHRIFRRDPVLARALDCCPGIRVLRQDPWETVCTFIISANNNLPRIRGIVERLCQGWGPEVGEGLYGFPTPQAMAALTPEDLAPLRAGYRTGYLLATARQVASGEVDLEALERLPTQQALEQLCRLRGVGVKVASCILLFAYGRMECVPVDVWIRRVMERLYPQGWPREVQPYGGIAQQVLFHQIRQNPSLGL